ncbi:hypothetical protein ACFVAM_12150 [Streptomyces californicus]
MAKEWTDPRYADLVAAWRAGQAPDSRDSEEPRPVRGFVIPAEPEA